jgi:putative membrane protein
MKRLISFIIFLITIIFGLIFAVLNAEPVAFNYYLGKGEFPLSLILVITLAIGAVLGVLGSLTVVLKSKRELAKVRKTAKLQEKEVMNLRALPLKEKH